MKVAVVLVAFVAMLSAPAVDACSTCSPGVVFSSDSFQIQQLTAAPDDSVYAVAIDQNIPRWVLLHIREGEPAELVTEIGQTATDSVGDIRVDSENVYVIAHHGSNGALLLAIRRADGVKSVLAADDVAFWTTLAIDDQYAYWLIGETYSRAGSVVAPASVQRVALAGGPVETMFANSQATLYGLAVDSAWIYFGVTDALRMDNVVVRLNKSNGIMLTVTKLDIATNFLVAENGSLYIAESFKVTRIDPDGAQETVAVAPAPYGMPWTIGAIQVRYGSTFGYVHGPERYCSDHYLFQLDLAGGTAISSFGNIFAVTGCALYYAYGGCFLVRPQPPFTITKACPWSSRRRVAGR